MTTLVLAVAVVLCKLPCGPKGEAPKTCPQGHTLSMSATGTCPSTGRDECPIGFVPFKAKPKTQPDVPDCRAVRCVAMCKKPS